MPIPRGANNIFSKAEIYMDDKKVYVDIVDEVVSTLATPKLSKMSWPYTGKTAQEIAVEILKNIVDWRNKTP